VGGSKTDRKAYKCLFGVYLRTYDTKCSSKPIRGKAGDVPGGTRKGSAAFLFVFLEPCCNGFRGRIGIGLVGAVRVEWNGIEWGSRPPVALVMYMECDLTVFLVIKYAHHNNPSGYTNDMDIVKVVSVDALCAHTLQAQTSTTLNKFIFGFYFFIF
jgi:hypothetical protein